MAVTTDRVVVELEAKLDRYTARVLGAAKTFDRSAGQIEQRARQAERAVSGAFRNIAAAAGIGISVAGSLAAARAYLEIADSSKQMAAQLKLATAETGNFLTAQDDVRRIAAETRTDLGSTTKLYATLMRTSADLGITQAQAARAAETMSKTFLISGASAVETTQGMRQFIQALQSGVQRGDEFNTMAELAPRYQKLLAESLGVTQGELRKMAEQGKLTASIILDALTNTKFTEGIDAEFKQLPVTFDQAMTQVRNAAVITFGAFDRGGEFSQALINFMMGGVDNMDQLEQRALDLGIEVRATFESLNNVFNPMGDNAISVFSIIRGEAIGLRNLIADMFGAMDRVQNAYNRLSTTAPKWSVLSNPVSAPVAFGTWMGRALTTPASSLPASNRRERFLAGTRAGEERQRTKTTVQSFREQEIFGAGFAPGAEPDVAGPARITPGSGAKKKKGRKGPSAETLANRAEAARLREARNEEAFQQQMARFNDDIIAARQARATAADVIAEFEVQSIELERQRQESAINAQVTQKRIDEAKAVQLRALNDELAQEKTRNVRLQEEQRIRAERVEIAAANLKNEEEITEAWGAMAETADEQRAVALRILDLQFQQERLELEAIIASEKATAAQKAIAEARLRILGQLKGARTAQIERDNRTPAQEYIAGLNKSQAQMNEDFQRMGVGWLDTLNDGLAEAVANADSLGDVFDNLGDLFHNTANQIIADLLRIAIQQMIIKPLAEFAFGTTSADGSSSGGALAALFKMGSSYFGRASGGKVVPGTTYLTGENGPEPIRVGQAGVVTPNHRLSAGALAGGTGVAPVVRLYVVAGEMFEQRVASISGDVSIEVVRQAAPHLTDAAVAEAGRRLGREGF